MSLITLKNNDTSKPYSWRNYFREPLEIEPKSSISLVSAVVNPKTTINMIESKTFYFRMGKNTILNPVQTGQLDPNTEVFDIADLVENIQEELRAKSGQPTFCNNIPTLGWESFIDTTLANLGKITFVLSANALPDELPTEVWTDVPNTYFTTVLGVGATTYTRIVRTGVVAPTMAEMSCGASWSEGICPRNGGHMIFKPRAIGGVYQRDQKFALGATYQTESGSQLNYFQTPAGQAGGAPFGSIGIHMIAGALGSALAQPYVNLGDFVTGGETPLGVAYQTVGATPVVFCIEWVDPYSMLIKYSLDYAPAVPGTDFLNATWVTMYDMRNDAGEKLQFPTYIDNFSPMVLMRGINTQLEVRGTLSTTVDKAGKWDWVSLGYARDAEQLEHKIDLDELGDAFVGAYPNVYLNKKIEILGDTIGINFVTADSWEQGIIGDLQPTEFSLRIGSTDLNIVLENDSATYDIYSDVMEKLPTISNYIPTMHIQLTNLGIKSKNGVVSNNVKDIAVIPLFDAVQEDNTLHYIAPYENRINLNNLEYLNINELDILITDDENIPADFLREYSSVIIKIHKGEV